MINKKNVQEHVLPFFSTIAKHDLFSEAYWHQDFKFLGIICNDVFAWGCGDLEEVASIDDVNQLDRACEEAGEIDGPILYCARRRGMRPQGAMYKGFQKENWILFDACGPEREIDLFNPQNQEGKYLFK